jgi:CheY-like chemotaxis protein
LACRVPFPSTAAQRRERYVVAKARCTVLIIDDEEQVRDVLARTLISAGYEVRVAADGRQALETVQSTPRPDAIVLDLLMPVMSGFEVLSALRVVPGWAEIPVVVLSGTADYTAEHLGVDVLLQKPFASKALTAAVEAAIAAKSTSRS